MNLIVFLATAIVTNTIGCVFLTLFANRERRPWSIQDLDDMFLIFMRVWTVNNIILVTASILLAIVL